MAKVVVYDWNKDKVSGLDLSAEVFEAPVRKDIMHTVVKWQLARRRQGTHSTKTRGLVSGGGKKPFKQKGTGNARQGSSRSPLHPGGGTTFGPQPRNYDYALPKKIRQAGLRSALSYLVSEGKLFVVKDMAAEGKTKEMAARLKKFGANKAVLVGDTDTTMAERAIRNLPGFIFQSSAGVNVYDLLKYDTAIISESSVEKIVARCSANSTAGGAE